MTRAVRLDELKALKSSCGDILSSSYKFDQWHGRVSGLLGFDPIARHKFDVECDYILREHDFGGGMIHENIIQAENKMRALVSRAISDLEINRSDSPIPLPVQIGPLAQISIPSAAASVVRQSTGKGKLCPSTVLTNDEGPLWFWHHCHYTVKWKLLAMAGISAASLLWIGWIANEQEVLRDIGHAFQKRSTPPAKTPDSNADPKTIAPKS